MQWLHLHQLSHTLRGHASISVLVHAFLHTSYHGNSLPVMSSMHMTCCSFSPTSANIECLSRLCLARPFMIDLHTFSCSSSFFSSSVLDFSAFHNPSRCSSNFVFASSAWQLPGDCDSSRSNDSVAQQRSPRKVRLSCPSDHMTRN